MIFNFIERNKKTGLPKITATANITNKRLNWVGDSKSIISWLSEERFSLLKNKPFNFSSLSDWEKLPAMVSGSYFWVAKQ